jgi:hypothetical protein
MNDSNITISKSIFELINISGIGGNVLRIYNSE